MRLRTHIETRLLGSGQRQGSFVRARDQGAHRCRRCHRREWLDGGIEARTRQEDATVRHRPA